MTIRPLTEEDAYSLYDFVLKRLFGWTIVIGCNNPSGRIDGRRREARLSDRLLRDTYISAPKPTECARRLLAGEDPECLWPEEQREFVRFCLWHRVPREINEPLSEKDFEEFEGQTRNWPDFLKQYDQSATLADMPEPPPPSAQYLKLQARRRR